MTVARKDVRTCLTIWKNILLEEFPEKIEVIYSKGSACKPWTSAIDYVPIISDVDIHVRFTNSNQKGPLNHLSLDKALDISQQYENLFLNKRKESLHLPRTQIVSVNKLIEDSSFIFPRSEDILLLYGWYDSQNLVVDDTIRALDKENVLTDFKYLENVPGSVFDRTGLDYWSLFRRINWRISPAPVRLLTQMLPISPYEIWTWNRSKIVRELIKQDLTSLAKSYQDYYLTGWKLFLADFSETKYYRELLNHGYSVLSKISLILKNL